MYLITLSNVHRFARLVAFASLLVGLSVTNAAVYRTIWDPILDPTYNQTLGWTGTGELSLADPACLTGPADTYPSAACGIVQLTSYSLAFYDPYPLGPLVGAIGPTTLPPLPLTISAIKVDGSGGLIGVELAGGPFYAGTFNLPFDNNDNAGFELVDAYLNFVIDGAFAGPTLQLYSTECDGEFCLQATSLRSESLNNLTWALVPEPTSLALIGVALAALGLTRRRTA